jgi:hypothetical protein
MKNVELMKRSLCVVLILLFAGYVANRYYDNLTCPIKPFRTFAYLPDWTASPIPMILPGPPWQVEAGIPGGDHWYPGHWLMLARTNKGEQEIWIYSNPEQTWSTYEVDTYVQVSVKDATFLVYRPASQSWGEVPAAIGDTNLIVRDLFLTSDGAVWGSIWSWNEPPVPASAPVLSRFNDSSQRFEAVIGGVEIPIVEKEGNPYRPAIVVDKEDVFWLFVGRDGIYRYDSKTGITDRQANLPDPRIYYLRAALALDGSIYFAAVYPYLADGPLFQFIPATGKVVPVKIPEGPWTSGGGLLVDRRGRLWLGATGYMNAKGQWRAPHPTLQYFTFPGDPSWGRPTLIFESSNGLLWYYKYLDIGERRGEGTAWYNPKTGRGCLFTNLISNIVEDDERQLWMIAEGKLYRYPLGK